MVSLLEVVFGLLEVAVAAVDAAANTSGGPTEVFRPTPSVTRRPARGQPAMDPEVLERRRRLGQSIATLLFAIAHADGRTDSRETTRILDVLRRDVGLSSDQATALALKLKDVGASSPEVNAAAADCRARLTIAERGLVLEALYAIALADDSVHRTEQASIRSLAALLQLPPELQRSALARHRGATALAYEILGVHESATDAQVKDAYLRMSTVIDPSQLSAHGADVYASAQERQEQLRAAYEEIRRVRRL